MPRMTAGRYIAELFLAYGVRAVFFVPTILSRPLAEMDEMPIKRVLAHGEKAAAYMADGYARASGRPGICGAQTVGAANLAAGLRDAFLSQSPVIAFTGGRLPAFKHRGAYQEIDDYPLFVPLTKANFQVDEAARLPDLLRQAFREAVSGPPGPVNLQLLGNHGHIEDDEADFDLVVEEAYTRVPAHRPAPEPVRVREAARLIQEAARPVIVAGGGARHSGAGVELRELAERIGCPVATSVAAYSLVPEDHPLYIGVPGTYSRSCANKALQRADLVLYVGSRTGSQVTHFWQVPRPGTAVIQVGVDPGDLGRNYPNAVPLLGDARVTLRALIEALPRTDGNGAWLTEVQGLAADWRGEAAPLRNSDAVPMRPERILKELGGALPEDVLLVCDTGHSAMWAAQHLWMNSVKWDFIRCAGSLGWAFPAALGVKCARPERPVVCFTGDGGFWYHIQEVETAVRCGINTVTVVNNNHSLNQETSVFVNAYSGNPSGKQGEMWHFSKQSLARVAESMGAAGFRAEAPGEIRPAVEKALACGRPAVVEVMSDIEALAPVAWTG